jgi:hypothetical protein
MSYNPETRITPLGEEHHPDILGSQAVPDLEQRTQQQVLDTLKHSDRFGIFEPQSDGTFLVKHHPLLEGHFRGSPVLPGVLLEDMLVGEKEIGKLYGIRIENMVLPGDRICIKGNSLYKVVDDKEVLVARIIDTPTLIKEDFDTYQKNGNRSEQPTELIIQTPPFLFASRFYAQSAPDGSYEGSGSFMFTKQHIEQLGLQTDIVPRALVQESMNQISSGIYTLATGGERKGILLKESVICFFHDVHVGEMLVVKLKGKTQGKREVTGAIKAFALPTRKEGTCLPIVIAEATITGTVMKMDMLKRMLKIQSS